MNNNKSFYVAGALLGIAHKYDKKFFYTIDTNNDIVEGIFYDFNSSKTKYIKCFINKMTNINDTLDEIERYIKGYMNSPEPDFITKNFHIPRKPITRLGDLKNLTIHKVIFNDPATIVFWSDGTKTVVKTRGNDKFDPEKGLTMAISKKHMGNADGWYKDFKKWLPEENDISVLLSQLKEYNNVSVGCNIHRLNEGCTVNFFNEDDNGNTTDDNRFHIKPEVMYHTVSMLYEYLPDEFKVDFISKLLSKHITIKTRS